MPPVTWSKGSRRRYSGSGPPPSTPPQCRSLSPASSRRTPSENGTLRNVRPTPGNAFSKRSAAGTTTVRIQSGAAVMRSRPPRPARVSATRSSASANSRSRRLARSRAAAPSAVRRTPVGRRSKSAPPARRSSFAMARVSAGWVIESRSAAATMRPASATARSCSTSLRVSNIAPLLVDRAAPFRVSSLLFDMGTPARSSPCRASSACTRRRARPSAPASGATARGSSTARPTCRSPTTKTCSPSASTAPSR